MDSENKMSIEDNLKRAFQSGYVNAATSLSQLINKKIHFKETDHGMHGLESGFFTESRLLNHQRSNRIITTDIFGDVTGKSYLFLSDDDFNFLTAGIPQGKDLSVNLKEEFLKELDNILSASVITRISNQMQLRMYGDVPRLIERVSGKVEDIIYDDFVDESEEVYVTSACFSIENHEHAVPFFVWVLDGRIFSARETRMAS